ncbi:LON peptidase N-terminal domain and RING finger protein 3 isoform X1 [Crotalus tigris]|uniref:LON peptidase N-terminal domain and RING finger protein 3 isoform X1 n=1 Tax=Crotalus tigris TaxID=88082 RepID=UPI00192F36FB|nr:LON peptidase N-terminal domain and RING finger protein 3 isoform X1 [Crotalus tigris]
MGRGSVAAATAPGATATATRRRRHLDGRRPQLRTRRVQPPRRSCRAGRGGATEPAPPGPSSAMLQRFPALRELVERLKRRLGAGAAGSGAAGQGPWGALGCGQCGGFLCEPVSLLCGHTFCKECVERRRGSARQRRQQQRRGGEEEEAAPAASGGVCSLCPGGESAQSRLRVNVILSHLLAKGFPEQVQAARLRQEGNLLCKEGQLQAALEKYDRALRLAPSDHLLYRNRSQINSTLKCYEEALRDAKMACELQPYWVKGHVRKGHALSLLGKTDEAFREFLLCLVLEGKDEKAESEATKANTDQEKYCEDQNMTNCDNSGNPLPSQEGSLDENGDVVSPMETVAGKKRPQKQKRQTEVAAGSDLPPKMAKMDQSDEQEESSSENCVAFDCVDPADLECSLCMRLFYEPVTTPCGHTFCLRCLERCLDHNPECPLCKEDLLECLAMKKLRKTVLMEELIAKYLPAELAERKKLDEEEMAEFSNLNKNVPIFVCTMAYPTVPCPLHIFEPCYRLMVRRCMETGTRQFGMCIRDPVKGFADYGCILEIRNVEVFKDGRSVVDSIGKRRFKVIRHSKCDGYNTADIEYIEDKKVHGEASEHLAVLHSAVYDQARTWFNTLKSSLKIRIIHHFGPMPIKEPDPQVNPDGPAWCWWILAVLPLENKAQLPFLAMTSLKARLKGIRSILTFLFLTQSK